jgi:hypothetical protein
MIPQAPNRGSYMCLWHSPMRMNSAMSSHVERFVIAPEGPSAGRFMLRPMRAGAYAMPHHGNWGRLGAGIAPSCCAVLCRLRRLRVQDIFSARFLCAWTPTHTLSLMLQLSLHHRALSVSVSRSRSRQPAQSCSATAGCPAALYLALACHTAEAQAESSRPCAHPFRQRHAGAGACRQRLPSPPRNGRQAAESSNSSNGHRQSAQQEQQAHLQAREASVASASTASAAMASDATPLASNPSDAPPLASGSSDEDGRWHDAMHRALMESLQAPRPQHPSWWGKRYHSLQVPRGGAAQLPATACGCCNTWGPAVGPGMQSSGAYLLPTNTKTPGR